MRGAHHFFHPSADPIKQADFFLSKVATCELPPVLDVEATDNVASAKLVHGANAWVEHIAARLRRPLIYASPSFWQKLPATDIEQNADLWIAEWDIQRLGTMGKWPGWSFWQYTSRGTVPGIAGSVDLNRFNGTIDDLHAYLTRTADGGSIYVNMPVPEKGYLYENMLWTRSNARTTSLAKGCTDANVSGLIVARQGQVQIHPCIVPQDCSGGMYS